MKFSQVTSYIIVVSLALTGIYLFTVKGAFAGNGGPPFEEFLDPPPFQCVADKFPCTVTVFGQEDEDSEVELEAFQGCCKKNVNELPAERCAFLVPEGETPPDLPCVHANIQVNPAFGCADEISAAALREELSTMSVAGNYLILMLPGLVIGARRLWRRFKK